MRKWILSGLAILLALLLDTAVIPVFYTGPFAVSLLLVLTFSIGMEAGPIQGLLAGLISGLLADITAGTNGDTLLAAMGVGLLSGLIAQRGTDAYSRRFKSRVYRALRALAISVITEGAVLFYRYYQVTRFEFAYLRPALFRAVLMTVLAYAISPVTRRVFHGTWRERARRSIGEEKKY